MIRQKSFSVSDLHLVARAPPADVPPLAIGDLCRLNSGSPLLLVTDADEDIVTVGWETPTGPIEADLPRDTVRRATQR